MGDQCLANCYIYSLINFEIFKVYYDFGKRIKILPVIPFVFLTQSLLFSYTELCRIINNFVREALMPAS